MIAKVTFTLVVLIETDSLDVVAAWAGDADPRSIAYDMSDGFCVGQFRHEATVEVTDDRVEQELVAIGNDGTFFERD